MAENLTKHTNGMDELEWVHIRNELYENVKVESFREKLVRKTKENPVVPIGITATVTALTIGLWSFYKGNSRMSQYMMRARVAAQSFTIFSLAVGFLLVAKNKERD